MPYGGMPYGGLVAATIVPTIVSVSRIWRLIPDARGRRRRVLR